MESTQNLCNVACGSLFARFSQHQHRALPHHQWADRASAIGLMQSNEESGDAVWKAYMHTGYVMSKLPLGNVLLSHICNYSSGLQCVLPQMG